LDLEDSFESMDNENILIKKKWWNEFEDRRLKELVEQYGGKNWK